MHLKTRCWASMNFRRRMTMIISSKAFNALDGNRNRYGCAGCMRINRENAMILHGYGIDKRITIASLHSLQQLGFLNAARLTKHARRGRIITPAILRLGNGGSTSECSHQQINDLLRLPLYVLLLYIEILHKLSIIYCGLEGRNNSTWYIHRNFGHPL